MKSYAENRPSFITILILINNEIASHYLFTLQKAREQSGLFFMPPILNASLTKRYAACVYELLLLIAIWLLCAGLFVMVFGQADSSNKRLFLQIFLWLVTGIYFVFCWHKSGQTLAAQTWKIKLVNAQNETLSTTQATKRYALASASLLACGLGYFWAIVDKEQLFLHDRLLGTRLIRAAP